MHEVGHDDPRWVDAILDWRWTWLLARAAMVGAFVFSGVSKWLHFSEAVTEQEALGLHPGSVWAALTIAVQLVAPALIISGRFVWLGAGALGVFTGLAALLAHPFWTMPDGQARFIATNEFFEHLGLIGGFIMTALVAEHAQRRRRNGFGIGRPPLTRSANYAAEKRTT